MDDAEAILREAEQIIDDERAVNQIMDLFSLGHRQAELTLHQIRGNMVRSARRAGVPLDEFIARMDTERKMAVFGFSAGVVVQRDYSLGLDPHTGERKPGPDYEI